MGNKNIAEEDREAIKTILSEVIPQDEIIVSPLIENIGIDKKTKKKRIQYKVAIPQKFVKVLGLNKQEFVALFTLRKIQKEDKKEFYLEAKIIRKQ